MAFNFDLSPLGVTTLTEGERSAQGTVGNSAPQTLVTSITFDGTQTNGDIIPLFICYGTDVFVDGGYWNDALSGLTDIDLGLYKLDATVVDADFFVDGDSLASAQDTPFGDNAMSAAGVIAQGDRSQILADLSASIDAAGQYVLAATVNTAGSASGVFEVKFNILRGN